jgi:uncharacterized damage-inducible protein DinB
MNANHINQPSDHRPLESDVAHADRANSSPAPASPTPSTEVWQRGPVAGFAPALQPVVHAILQVIEEIERSAPALTHEQLWMQPHGAGSAGFHLVHLAGSTERLLTYARGEALTAEQVAAARAETTALGPDVTARHLAERTVRALHVALEHIRVIDPATFNNARFVGRARIESTVGGLLFHAAEHASRHAGQLATTIKIVRGPTEPAD